MRLSFEVSLLVTPSFLTYYFVGVSVTLNSPSILASPLEAPVFHWRIIALQCCVVYCRATTQISHNYTYIPALVRPPPFPSPCPARSSQSTRLGSRYHTAASRWLSVLHLIVYMCQWGFLYVSQPLLSPLDPQVHFPCLHLHF